MFSTQPANLAPGLSGLTVPGYEPPEASNSAASDSNERNWFTPSWWWLLAGIPLLLLIGLMVVATRRNRGGGQDLDALERPGNVQGPESRRSMRVTSQGVKRGVRKVARPSESVRLRRPW